MRSEKVHTETYSIVVQGRREGRAVGAAAETVVYAVCKGTARSVFGAGCAGEGRLRMGEQTENGRALFLARGKEAIREEEDGKQAAEESAGHTEEKLGRIGRG